MAGFEFDSGLTPGLFGEIADVDVVDNGGVLILAVTGRFGVELWSISPSGIQTLLTTLSLIAAPGSVPETDLSVAGGVATLLVSGDFFGGSQYATVPLASPTPSTVTLGGPERHPDAEVLQAFGSTFLVNAVAGTSGLTLSQVAPAGALTAQTGLSATEQAQLGYVSLLESVVIGGRHFIVAISGAQGIVSVSEALADGSMALRATLGTGDGVPVDGASALSLLTVGGAQFAVVGATQTSALAVFRIDGDGALTQTDYVIDTLNTRFDAVQAVATLSGAALGHVVAGGGDDGLSYMALTPDGRLIHTQSIEDTLDTALDGVTAISIAQGGGETAVFTGDQAGGVSQFTLALTGANGVLNAPVAGGAVAGTNGDDVILGSALSDTLAGGLGDDIVLDGAGADALFGGGGADVFVLGPDNAPDTIGDLEPEHARLDLTGYLGATDPGALIVSGGPDQMTVEIDGDVLTLLPGGGVVLTEDAVRASVALSFDRPFLPTAARTLVGSEGADTLLGAAAGDTIDGAGGDDVIAGDMGADSLSGGAGNDLILGAGLDLAAPGPDPGPIPGGDVFDFF